MLGDTGLPVTVSGFPVLRLDIVDVLIHDQIVLNIAGVLVGMIMSLIVFRSVARRGMTAIPAILAGGAVLGIIGLLGTQITVMSNVVPALIMVLGYADAMHLTYAWRRYRAEGADPKEAERLAAARSRPGLHADRDHHSLAFLSLTLSDVELVSKFAWIGAIGTILGGMLVLAAHALLAIYIGRFWKPARGAGPNLLARLRRPNAAIGRFAVDNANRITVDRRRPGRRARLHVFLRPPAAFAARAPADEQPGERGARPDRHAVRRRLPDPDRRSDRQRLADIAGSAGARSAPCTRRWPRSTASTARCRYGALPNGSAAISTKPRAG